jgi:hypothetical protein
MKVIRGQEMKEIATSSACLGHEQTRIAASTQIVIAWVLACLNKHAVEVARRQESKAT